MGRRFISSAVATLLTATQICLAGPQNPFTLPADDAVRAAGTTQLKTPATRSDTPDQFAKDVKDFNSRLDPVDFDMDLRAKQLGDGVEPAFNFVRDQIRYEIYPGAFRGGRGCYLARAGDAADRSLLLGHLLQDKKIPVRLAFGTLAPDQAEILLKHMFDSAPTATITRTTDMIQRIHDRALRDYSVIRQALGADLPTVAGPSHDQLIAEITHHVWLQAKVGQNWVDLDSSFPDATVGKQYCAPFQFASGLPGDYVQTATMRVIVETLDNGQIKRETAVEVSRPVIDLLDRQIFLLHSAPSGLNGIGAAIAGTDHDTWTPVFWIDGDLTPGNAITFNSAPASTPAPAAGGGVAQSVLGAFGDDTPKPDAAPAGPVFVDEILEFEIDFPGGKKETTRRILCDAGSAAWRLTTPLDVKTLQPLDRNDNGPLAVQSTYNIWFSAGRHDLASYGQAMQIMADSISSSDSASSNPPAPANKPAENPDPGLQLWPLAMQNFPCAGWADQLFIPALNDNPDIRFYTDSPRILMFASTSNPIVGQPDNYSIRSEIDLRRDTVRGVARTPDAASGLASRKIWYGLLEGALEHETSANVCASLGAGTVSSTSALLDNRGVVVLRQSNAGWDSLANQRETAARLSGALANGDLAVVPQTVIDGPDVGWWAISPTTGDTHAILDRDINGGVYKFDGGRYGGGSSSSGQKIYEINESNYTSRVIDPNKPYTPRSTKNPSKGGGNEYATLLIYISVPGALALGGYITYKIVTSTSQAAGSFQ